MQLNKPATDIIIDALNQYSNTQLPVDDFLYQLLDESEAYSSDTEIKDTLNKISSTLEAISTAYHDIQHYKEKGLTTSIWLRDQLEQSVQHLAQDQQNEVIEAVKTALNNGNNQLLKQLSDGASTVDLVAALVSNEFSDLNKTACANNLQEEIQLNTLLNAIAVENIITADDIKEDCKAAIAYFVAPLDSETDNDFKKVVVAGVEIAKQKNLLPESLSDTSTEQITAIVDNGVTATKVAYKIAQGDIDPLDALDYLVDKTAARVKTVVTTACQTAGGSIGASVGALLGGLFNPAAAAIGAKVGRVVGAAAGKKVAEVVNKGVGFVASAAKSVARTVCEGAKSFCRGVASLFGW